jgi:3-oxoacyl-[acyl-carrier protein] reductase
MNLELDGKVALVTGGTSGIGLAIARRLLEERARVFICGRDGPRLEAALSELKPLGDVGGATADVARPKDVSRLVEEVVKAFGGLDIVVSNAGTHLMGSLEEVTGDQVEDHFRTKVLGAWELARRAAPLMRARGGGRFIVVIGQAGKVPGRDLLASAVVNAAQHGLVKSLSDDLGRDGITVNAVCPSRIETPLTRDLPLDGEAYLGRSLEQQESGWGCDVPLGRRGKPEDIADAVLFMASRRAGFICGSNIDVDGGHQRMIF